MNDNTKLTLETLSCFAFAGVCFHHGGVVGYVFAGVTGAFACLFMLLSN